LLLLGYAPVDALNLTPANLFEDNDGNLDNDKLGQTAIRENVPIPPAMAVIKKYKDKTNGAASRRFQIKDEYLLKGDDSGYEINKHLTWYVFQDIPLLPTVTLGNGVRLEHVSAMMGLKY
jgi:hypothetical protein